ncbi:hypothetical protein ACSX1C_01380 [Pseudomonas sp. MBLB4123]|uniref:hypothetical protein n=1 Tax=Pseudomonas sp. MBLB4123 TaxID=3451557 RepID=UPI003F74C599
MRYRSVRAPGNLCWALLTPREVTSIMQTVHFEMIWNGRVVGGIRRRVLVVCSW